MNGQPVLGHTQVSGQALSTVVYAGVCGWHRACSRPTAAFLFTGEKARRRDPRVYSYLAIPCPDTKEVRATAAMDTLDTCSSLPYAFSFLL